ncbi:MAG: thiamine pyrophosphate-binding protein [Acidimicrobiales bacterium]
MLGSDAMVAVLRRLGIDHVALNPGASTRGLHESLVHARRPEIVLALHEEVAVDVAHGYYKACGRPMAVLLHDLVGLQHASMAIFNAWIDQTPMLVIGGSGPADTSRRRPWIDWIHASRWQGLAARDIVKWDDQPASLPGVLAGLVRGVRLAEAPPRGPTYVAVDALLQEEDADVALPDPAAYPVAHPLAAPPAEIERLADLLGGAERPVIVTDGTGRDPAAYAPLIALTEALAAPVVDLGGSHSFPSTHWADCTDGRAAVLAEADAVLALDARDVTWALSTVDLETHGSRLLVRPGTPVASVGLGGLLHRGFLDREAQPEVAVDLTASTATVLASLAELVRERVDPEVVERRGRAVRSRSAGLRTQASVEARRLHDRRPISPARIAREVGALLEGDEWMVANGTLEGWVRRLWPCDTPRCHLGTSGGAGVGYGPGASVGAALATRGSGRIVVDFQSDGDLLYTPTALWTAAHHRLPLLVVTMNNRSYGKDRLHQATVARLRGRGIDRVHEGIDIDDPPVDLAMLARAQGVEGFGPVTDPDCLADAVSAALGAVREGRPALVDVVVGR